MTAPSIPVRGAAPAVRGDDDLSAGTRDRLCRPVPAVVPAKLPVIRLHGLRRAHATLALQAGIHPKVVSECLGHATVWITLDTCSHAIPALQEEAATLIANLVLAGK